MKTLKLLIAVLAATSLIATACGSDDDDAQPATTTSPPTTAPETTTTTTSPPTTAPETTETPATTTTAAPAPEELGELKIGYLLALEVYWAPSVITPIVKAIELARDEINAAGGNVVLVPADTANDVDVASEAADSLIADGVSAIVGAETSHVSLSVIDKITDAEIVMISPINSAPVFTHYDDRGYYFRTLPSDALQAIEMANLMAEDGVTKAGILYLEDAYGLGFMRSLQDRLLELGIRVGVTVPYEYIGFEQLQRDADADVQIMHDASVDGVAIIAADDSAVILGHKLEVGLDPGTIPFFISAAVAEGEWLDSDPEKPGVLDGTEVIFTSEFPEAGEPTFDDRFVAYAGDIETIYSTYAYDAVVIVALASLVAGSTDPKDFASEINDVTRGGTKCNLYADCAELIRNGVDIDYDGASGVLDFIDAGEPSNGAYDIFRFNEEGTLDFVKHEVIHVDELPR